MGSFFGRVRRAWEFFTMGLPVLHIDPPIDEPILFDTAEQALNSAAWAKLLDNEAVKRGLILAYILTEYSNDPDGDQQDND